MMFVPCRCPTSEGTPQMKIQGVTFQGNAMSEDTYKLVLSVLNACYPYYYHSGRFFRVALEQNMEATFLFQSFWTVTCILYCSLDRLMPKVLYHLKAQNSNQKEHYYSTYCVLSSVLSTLPVQGWKSFPFFPSKFFDWPNN